MHDNAIVKVLTNYVGKNSEIKIKVTESSGKTIKKDEKKISGNYLAMEIPIPKYSGEQLIAEVELPKHS